MLRRLFGARSREPYRLGMAHYNAGRLEEALASFEEMLGERHDPSQPEVSLAQFYRAEAHARLGAAALEEGRSHDALGHFDAALRDHPGYPDRHLRRGVALLELGDPLAAEQAARRALEGNDRFVEAGILLVMSLRDQGDPKRARDASVQWAEVAATKGHSLTSWLQGPIPTTAKLKEHLSAQRQRGERIARAEGLLNQGFWKEARAAFEALVAEAPEYPDIRLKLATSLAVLGDTTSAMLHLDAALARNPEFVEARILAGTVDLLRGDTREARRHLAAARERTGDSAALLFASLLCDLFEGETQAAAAQLERLCAENEVPSEAHVLRACLLAELGNRASSVALIGDIEWKHEALDAVLDGVACALRCEDDALARTLVEYLPAGAPEPAVALARAEVWLRAGELRSAMDVLEAATADHPESPALLWALAQLHDRRGEIELGLRRLANLDALDARVPGAHCLSARLLRRRKDHEAALGALGEAENQAADARRALETLYTLRAAGRADDARRLLEVWARVSPLELRWRTQHPRRWTAPLLPERTPAAPQPVPH